jgi:hypothetical protein
MSNLKPPARRSGDALQSLARLICAMLHSEPLLYRANHRLQRLRG